MRRLLLIVLCALYAPAGLAAEAQPTGVLNLSASASVEVTHDLLNVVLSTTREGADAGAVQVELKQALDAALAEARRAARPGQLDVHTGNFSLYPRHAPGDGRGAPAISGWQGTAELVIEGKDMNAIAELAARIGTMTIARVGYSLSREQREKVEADVAAQAIARYRAKAADYAKQFGYASVVMREINVQASEPPHFGPMAMSRAKTMQAADEALPVEPGKGTVTVIVNGSVQMLK
jgi:predicted secreted protein